MDEVCDDRAPLFVTRQNARTVVLMAEDEYESSHGDRPPPEESPPMQYAVYVQSEADEGKLTNIVDRTNKSSFGRGMKTAWMEYAWKSIFIEKEDENILEVINGLIRDIKRYPFRGLGRPQPLKYARQGWRRRGRISGEYRLVYRVSEG